LVSAKLLFSNKYANCEYYVRAFILWKID
jgi:hypothetical protein